MEVEDEGERGLDPWTRTVQVGEAFGERPSGSLAVVDEAVADGEARGPVAKDVSYHRCVGTVVAVAGEQAELEPTERVGGLEPGSGVGRRVQGAVEGAAFQEDLGRVREVAIEGPALDAGQVSDGADRGLGGTHGPVQLNRRLDDPTPGRSLRLGTPARSVLPRHADMVHNSVSGIDTGPTAPYCRDSLVCRDIGRVGRSDPDLREEGVGEIRTNSRLRVIRAAGVAEPMGHYSDAVLAGDTLYLSGVIATDENGALVGAGDLAAQARAVFNNLGRVLEAAGASPRDVVKVTIYMCDVSERLKMNEARRAFFGDHRPASMLLQVPALVDPGVLIEVEAVAVLTGP